MIFSYSYGFVEPLSLSFPTLQPHKKDRIPRVRNKIKTIIMSLPTVKERELLSLMMFNLGMNNVVNDRNLHVKFWVNLEVSEAGYWSRVG